MLTNQGFQASDQNFNEKSQILPFFFFFQQCLKLKLNLEFFQTGESSTTPSPFSGDNIY